MIHPTRDEFAALAKEWTVVPVWRELLADLTTPVAAFARLAGADTGERAFLLESVEHNGRWGRWSFIGRRPSATLVARGRHVTVEGTLPPGIPTDGGILAALRGVLDAYRSPHLDGLPPLHGGLVGYLGYDVVREVERLPDVPPDERGYPDAILSVVGQVIAYDSWRQRVVLVEAVPLPAAAATDPEVCGRLYDEAVARLDQLAGAGAHPLDEPVVEPPAHDDDIPEHRRRTTPELYAAAVEAAKEHIVAGDIFQVVLSQRFEVDLQADPFDLYRSLRQVNPSPSMFFVRNPEVCLIGASPEPLVQLRGRQVISRPIAGTRRRGRTEEHDRHLAAELSEHPKERAEHVMLVDLARNDVGRVAEYGSVHVDELMTLERYSHVMHLTSQVSGRLREGLGPIDVLAATMPAGTVSGAPKVRAMEIIDTLEPAKRGPYAGTVGYFDFSGNLDTAIAIRTMVVGPDGRAEVQAGAGIVADSQPDDEDLECRNKAAALLAAVPGARRITAARRAAAGAAATATASEPAAGATATATATEPEAGATATKPASEPATGVTAPEPEEVSDRG
ncbi:MAG TPA: anthranilate synthase component I [Acidimicrobiales bacterium]|nr:anthranilate synthase component I [Acidimicrobiales bacterium]